MKTKCMIFLCLILILFALFVCSVSSVQPTVVYLRDGGNGDGSSYEQATGDFRDAVRVLKEKGGTIIVCGKYTFSELINLSEKSGTSNGKNLIKVTSVDGEKDYRVLNGASINVGDDQKSGNMILAGEFVFENININTSGSEKARAIIANGFRITFGEGIICNKYGKAPYISIIGGSIDEDIKKYCEVVIKSGSYYNVCASNKNGMYKGNTILTIDGGVFEGQVSVTGLEDEGSIKSGNAQMIVNGGTFINNAGALTQADNVIFTVNNGNFNNDIILLGKKNTFEINGGFFQRTGSIKIGINNNTDDEDNNLGEKSVLNINQYSGDMNNLISKIVSNNLIINTKTDGGSDFRAETTSVSESVNQDNETSINVPKETALNEQTSDNATGNTTDRAYFLGTRQKTVFAIIILFAIVLFASIVFSYRMANRKNKY